MVRQTWFTVFWMNPEETEQFSSLQWEIQIFKGNIIYKGFPLNNALIYFLDSCRFFLLYFFFEPRN